MQYECEGFLDKNRGTVFEELVNILKASQVQMCKCEKKKSSFTSHVTKDSTSCVCVFWCVSVGACGRVVSAAGRGRVHCGQWKCSLGEKSHQRTQTDRGLPGELLLSSCFIH